MSESHPSDCIFSSHPSSEKVRMNPLVVLLICVLWIFILRVGISIIWTPWMIRRHFSKQGIRGPPYRPINGNTKEALRMYAKAQSKPMELCHDILQRVAPFYHRWSAMYGKNFLYWHGCIPRLGTSDPDIMKEVLLGGSFERLDSNPLSKLFYGEGLIALKGDQWATHRRIANKAFKLERVKVILDIGPISSNLIMPFIIWISHFESL